MNVTPEIVDGASVPPVSPPPPPAPPAGADRMAYTTRDFAQRLSISESFVWKMLGDGRLNAVKIGRRVVIPHSEATRLLAMRREASPAL